jgi:Lipid A 3-O-deacylase (PagL)
MRQFLLLLLAFGGLAFAQENTNAISFSGFRGNVLKHTQDLGHLVTGHPDGFLVNFDKQTNGGKEWHKAFNYPDYGAYFMYQDYKNEFLGTNLAAGLHYNFYFLNRNLQFKIAQGITYNNKPYDKITNSKNKAFGSRLDANINLGLNYKKDNIYENIGFQTGFLFTHSSNGRFKSPNSGINSFVFNFGLNYNFEKNRTFKISEKDTTNYRQPIHYNLVFRIGLNESPVIGSGQFPLYHFAAYADKRLNRKSSLQLGAELFLTMSQKEYIKYKAISNFEKYTDPNTDYKRMGIMFGHELHINKLSIETQVGYYVYQPFKDDIAIYDRLGLKYYINKNIFAVGTLKTHLFYAEAFEFGVGYRL